MASAGEVEIRLRLVIDNPVPGVLHSLQEDDRPLESRKSAAGEPLSFDLPIRYTPPSGDAPARFLGKQVRREGKERRFVYIRIGTSAGDRTSPWTRRMKIDIHDIDPALLAQAIAGGVLEGTFDGTGKDGTPACATIKPVSWSVV